jgi:hypothetical protein
MMDKNFPFDVLKIARSSGMWRPRASFWGRVSANLAMFNTQAQPRWALDGINA